MKILAISDTHGQHASLQLPEADMIIHAGDISRKGTENQVRDFLQWFSALPHRHKIFIAGNHDFFFENAGDTAIAAMIPEGIIYLNDSGVAINGITIWGSPVQPWFYDWAFNRQRGAAIQKHWALVPAKTDILVTHGPAAGLLDQTIHGLNVGCEDLRKTIRQVRPKVHICGHIHEAYGTRKEEETLFINASVLDETYSLKNEAVLFEL